MFSEDERAALRFAQAAAAVPNAVTDEDMGELRKHFDDDQMVEILAVVCWYGFLNRWNDSLATELEPPVFEYADRTMAPKGWDPGKHAPKRKKAPAAE